MDYREEHILAQEFYDECLRTLVSKANDYASVNDCFSNFKIISKAVKIPVEKVFLTFIMVKVARLVELLGSDKIAKNESVSDSLKDLANYSCLLDVYLKEVE